MVIGSGALTAWVVSAGVRLADATPSPSGTPRYEDDAVVRPGFLGFAVFLALLAASYFLFRSMQRHLKKVDFEEERTGGGSDPKPPPAAGP